MRKWILTLAALLGLIGPVPAAQYDFGTIIPESTSGAQLASHLNSWRTALHSLHSGSSRPSYATAGTLWIDTSGSPWLLKLYGGVSDTTLGPIDLGVLATRMAAATSRPSYVGPNSFWVNITGGAYILTFYDGATDFAVGPLGTSTMGVAPGVEAPFAGIFPPTGWLLEAGQEVSRTTYANLFNAITHSFSCTTVNGNTGLTATHGLTGTGVGINWVIEGPGLAPGHTLNSVIDATGLLLNGAAGVGAGSGTCRVFPHGNGNASSTFNVPDRRGRVIAGRDTMNNTNAGRLEVYFGDHLGSWGGQEYVQLSAGHLAAHTHPGSTFSGSSSSDGHHEHSYNRYNELLTVDADDGGGSISNTNRGSATPNTGGAGSHTHTVSGSATIASQGSSDWLINMPPTGVSNYIIKY